MSIIRAGRCDQPIYTAEGTALVPPHGRPLGERGARVDVLVSRNFKHIVNLSRIHGYNSVNLRRGYPTLEIRAPREVLSDE